jgi:YidC/Oxa1 family membrane protein insertase
LYLVLIIFAAFKRRGSLLGFAGSKSGTEMNFDRNTVIGFVLLAILFIGFFYYTSQQQAALQKQTATKDSIARAKDSLSKLNSPKTASLQKDTGRVQSPAAVVDSTAEFAGAKQGTESLTPVENDLIKVVFTNKGGQPKYVELKKFQGPDSNNVRLAGTGFDKIDYRIATGSNQTDSITGLYFSDAQIRQEGDTSIVTYQLQSKDGNSIVHTFRVTPDYMISFDLAVNGVQQLLPNNNLLLTWQNQAVRQQKDISYERQQSQIGYRENGDYDYSSAMRSNSEEFSKPVNWVAVKQQFFNSAFIAKNNFSSGSINWVAPSDKETVVEAVANLKIQLSNNSNSVNVPLALYYGPTDYKTLKKYGNDMENMVNLGSGMFAFVKYINRWIVIPVFNWFSKFTSNFGIVILLLTLFIRLVISPLTYSSYLSGAKMKVLRPEIEQLKAKYGGDQQQMSVEQMKLFKEAGVNPLGGCIPALLQIPIFFALYSFFNSNVALRGQSFLWANDLSQYDSIAKLPFSIPFYGDHVSLFTITAVITSFLISLYSMSTTPDQGNPVLKYMPYFFPVMLLFIFNKLPSGLTWYYTVSNLITLILQFVIQNYIIDHDKILARIAENRKKPKKQSKWQERLAQMQEQQKQMRDTQNKNRR